MLALCIYDSFLPDFGFSINASYIPTQPVPANSHEPGSCHLDCDIPFPPAQSTSAYSLHFSLSPKTGITQPYLVVLTTRSKRYRKALKYHSYSNSIITLQNLYSDSQEKYKPEPLHFLLTIRPHLTKIVPSFQTSQKPHKFRPLEYANALHCLSTRHSQSLHHRSFQLSLPQVDF